MCVALKLNVVYRIVVYELHFMALLIKMHLLTISTSSSIEYVGYKKKIRQSLKALNIFYCSSQRRSNNEWNIFREKKTTL